MSNYKPFPLKFRTLKKKHWLLSKSGIKWQNRGRASGIQAIAKWAKYNIAVMRDALAKSRGRKGIF